MNMGSEMFCIVLQANKTGVLMIKQKVGAMPHYFVTSATESTGKKNY
jgi:hypothetical protein